MSHRSFACLVLLAGSVQAQNAGNALHLDGINDRVSASVPPLFSNPGVADFTFEAWVFRPSVPAFGRILFVQQDTSNFFAVTDTTSNLVYFYVANNGTSAGVVTAAGIPIGRWVHLTARWRAAQQERLVYFDGVEQATGAGGSSSSALNAVMMIGARTDGAQPMAAGRIDELRLWDRARSVCEIRRDMFVRVPANTPNLVTYYDFNQGIAGADNSGTTTLPDLSGGDQNGTLTNFALIGSTSNWVASDLPTSPPTGAGAVQIDRNALVTGEYGLNDGFNVVLGYAPIQNVVINISNGDPSEGTLMPTTLTFTSANWNMPQPVTVIAVDDGVADGDTPYDIMVSVDASSDETYVCALSQTITVINLEDRLFGNGFE